jgi:hypothetical protein
MFRFRDALRILMGALIGAVIGLTSSVLVGQYTTTPALAVNDPFRLLDGTYSACEDWKNDNNLWKDVTGDGVAEPFKFWWSGHSRFWNLPSANGCWHSDEGNGGYGGWGNPYRPSVDYNGSTGTDVWFRMENYNSYNWWPALVFENTGCRGLQARVWAPGGA